MISGWAALRASAAADLSPEAIASSTLRRKVRIRERRPLLTSVRRTILRAAFLADVVLAIETSSSSSLPDAWHYCRRAWPLPCWKNVSGGRACAGRRELGGYNRLRVPRQRRNRGRAASIRRRAR